MNEDLGRVLQATRHTLTQPDVAGVTPHLIAKRSGMTVQEAAGLMSELVDLDYLGVHYTAGVRFFNLPEVTKQ